MLNLWVDIYSPTGVRLGTGPITTVTDARVSRVLDGAGTLTFSFPLGDYNGLRLLEVENRFVIYTYDTGTVRELGRGIITDISTDITPSGQVITVSGPDLLDELRRRTVHLGRNYSLQTLKFIFTNLVSVEGWSVNYTGPTQNTSIRFDGCSILKAVEELAKRRNLHFRLSPGSALLKQVDVGPMGDHSGVVLNNSPIAFSELDTHSHMGLIESLQIQSTSSEIVNWILPLGQGEGASALTLAKSTRNYPYTVQRMTGPDGRTLYYLKDENSIAEYGQIERVVVFREIGILSNSAQGEAEAANALYDAASSWMARRLGPNHTYRLRARKVDTDIYPGDKVHVNYQGLVVDQDGRPLREVDINQDFWVLRVNEIFNVGGRAIDLEISNVDVISPTPIQAIANYLEEVQIMATRVQTYPSVRSFKWMREMSSVYSADLYFTLTDATVSINRVKLKFQTRPYTIPSGTGVTKDTLTPNTISLSLDGEDVTGDLGGPWAVGGGNHTISLDLTPYFSDPEDPDFEFRGEHTLVFTCTSDRGEIEVELEIFEVTQSITL